MHQDDAPPTNPQVKRQLDDMLEDPIFLSRVQEARVLKYLVDAALRDGDVSEQAILQDVFQSRKRHETGSNIVRFTVAALRKSLKEYYDRRDDLVIITLPKSPPGKKLGDAYRPRFEYNPHRQITKDYMLACSLMRRGLLNELQIAGTMFQTILDVEPNHAGAMACLADALCWIFMLYDLPNEMNDDLLEMVSDLTNKALELGPKFWRSHAARAAYHCCRNENNLAKEQFEIALKLDRSNAESQTVYSLLLFKRNQACDALQLVGQVAEDQFDDPTAQCIYGMHLYRAGRLADAERAFQLALRIDRNCWMAHLVAAFVYSKLGRWEEARKHAKRLEVLLDDPVHYEHWMSGIAWPPEQ